MTLQVAGNEVTGSAQVLDESAADPEFRTFAVDNGTLVGSRAQLDLVGTNTRWTWELRLAGNVLVGSYQRRDVGTDAFLSRGSAEWRRASSLTIVGAWAAGFHDTFASGAVGDRIGDSQLAYVEVSDSSINGQGSLRIAGDRPASALIHAVRRTGLRQHDHLGMDGRRLRRLDGLACAPCRRLPVRHVHELRRSRRRGVPGPRTVYPHELAGISEVSPRGVARGELFPVYLLRGRTRNGTCSGASEAIPGMGPTTGNEALQ